MTQALVTSTPAPPQASFPSASTPAPPERFANLPDMLRQATESFASARLFGFKVDGRWEWLTYGDFALRVDRLRGGLRHLGIDHGDTVAIIAANRVEWAIAAYATYGLGARFCPMYEHQHERDWRYILEDSGARVVLASSRAIFEVVRGWTAEIEPLEHAFCMALPEEDDASFLALERRGAAHPAAVADIDADDVCGFIYTSGTTGRPKGVLLTHRNICSNLNGVSAIVPIEHGDVSLSFLPWAHSFGQTCELHALISRGAAMAIAESIEKLIDNFAEVRPTLLFAVPRIFNRIYDGLHKRLAEEGGLKKALFDAAMRNAELRLGLEAEGKSSLLLDLKHAVFDRLVFSKVRARFGGRLRYALSGGAALAPEVADFIDRLGIYVCEGYGLTETSPIVTTNYPGQRKIGSVGRPLPGVEVVIDTSVTSANDDAGQSSGDGEIVVKGPNVMRGYHGLDEETAEVIGKDGAFRTGDLGRLDADGYLYITGRIKEQYKLENGKYVVPAPLEDLLQLSPFISQAFLYGDNKPFNVALLVPDREALAKWARENGLAEAEIERLFDDERVQALFEAQLEEYGAEMKGYEKVRRFQLLTEEFSIENGMLTPKMSLKRNVVLERFAAELDALYAR